jgi:hypothetical protein
MNSIDEIFSLINTLDREKKQLFYFKLGFNLTISIRSFSHDARYDDQARLEGVKNINELSHRNFNWLWRVMYSAEPITDDSYMLGEVKNIARHTRTPEGK